MGRFGNQMFQFASTVGIARKLGFDPVFPAERFKQGSAPNSYDGCKLLECFDIPLHLIKESSDITIDNWYHESTFSFDVHTKTIQDNTSISGYFQSSKYFDFISDEIRDIFTFKEDVIERAKRMAKITNGVSVHIRRGDYLASPDHHPTQSIEYYQNAVNYFNEESIFYIFSDDIEWCRDNIKIQNSEIIESNDPYVDMYLMSQCEGHIIANSSFSWWGSWLANSKKTIAPLNWFGKYINNDVSDVYCKNWIII